jgi:hypothetical protein
VEMVSALLTIPGINPNAADAFGIRPIHVAVRRGCVLLAAAKCTHDRSVCMLTGGGMGAI